SAAPSWRSSSPRAMLMAGWVRCSWSAAWRTPPAVATATKTSSWRMLRPSMVVGSPGRYQLYLYHVPLVAGSADGDCGWPACLLPALQANQDAGLLLRATPTM